MVKNILFCLGFIAFFCLLLVCDSHNTTQPNYESFDTKKIQQYETAKAENQESYVYITGVLCNSFELDSNTAITVISARTLYILIIGKSSTSYTDELEKYSQENVAAYGTYEGIYNIDIYGNAPMIRIDEIIITNEDTTFKKSDLFRYERQTIKQIDEPTLRKIRKITPFDHVKEYNTFDKKTKEINGPKLSFDITANTPKEVVAAAEKIVNMPELRFYESIILSYKDNDDSLLGTIHYRWDKENQQYYSSCIDFSDEKELKKEYQKNPFFQMIDIQTLRSKWIS